MAEQPAEIGAIVLMFGVGLLPAARTLRALSTNAPIVEGAKLASLPLPFYMPPLDRSRRE